MLLFVILITEFGGKNMKLKKKYLFFSIVGILIVAILGIFGYEYQKIQSTANTISTNHSLASRQQLKQGKPFSILVLGTDVGALGRGTSYAGNTDTLELITVNPKKQTLTTTAIPRDTLVRVETKNKVEYTKINAAYALGYSRMGYDDPDNDYGRKKRGQQVLLSALTKVNKSKNIMQMNSLLDTAKDNVRTDLPLDDLMTLYKNYHGALSNTQSDHL